MHSFEHSSAAEPQAVFNNATKLRFELMTFWSAVDCLSTQDTVFIAPRQTIWRFFLQIFSINSDAESLISFYPDAVDHIMAKRRELLRAIEKLDSKVKERDEMVSCGGHRVVSRPGI